MADIFEQKKLLRKQCREERKKIVFEEKIKLDKQICKNVTELECYRNCDTVLLYASLENEISTDLIAADALSKGKKIAYPRCIDDSKMEFRFVSGPGELETGKYGIKEPKTDLPLFENKGRVLCIVPGLAFDKKGYRIGYGKGYYDRFFRNYDVPKVGLAYSGFIFETIPTDGYDVKCDVVVTEKGVDVFR